MTAHLDRSSVKGREPARAGIFANCLWWDDRGDGTNCETLDKAVTVITLVTKHCLGCRPGSQRCSLLDVVNITDSEAESERRLG